MGDDRLSSLALLHVHREIEIDVECVLELFTSQKNRKLAFFKSKTVLSWYVNNANAKLKTTSLQ
jgi:hypothetical protein